MKQVILAKRYARALYSIGCEQKKEKSFGQTLNSFVALMAKRPEVKDSITNRLYPQDVRERVIDKLVKAAGFDVPVGNFFRLLVKKRRADILPEIAESYQEMLEDAQGISHGTVVTATKTTKAITDKIQKILEKITGRKVELETSVDESIIGGMIARVGDLELDGSIRTQLAGLKDSIKGR
ncbi:MAG: ATP synthase F1 subunit delta [Desulforhopalus sp.]|nr:ATP synthase F1 subunit delta [Desulforhopalus sp.]